jgi:hypothetical protein
MRVRVNAWNAVRATDESAATQFCIYDINNHFIAETNEANARLIAAAPEMLALVKKVLKDQKVVHRRTLKDGDEAEAASMMPVINRLKKVVARAESSMAQFQIKQESHAIPSPAFKTIDPRNPLHPNNLEHALTLTFQTDDSPPREFSVTFRISGNTRPLFTDLRFREEDGKAFCNRDVYRAFLRRNHVAEENIAFFLGNIGAFYETLFAWYFLWTKVSGKTDAFCETRFADKLKNLNERYATEMKRRAEVAS